MSDELTIGVLGATGALGSEVIRVLDAAPWRPNAVLPLARASTSIPLVEYGGEKVAVDDVAHQSFAGLDALIVAIPRDVGGEFVTRAVREGVPVVDLSGSQLEDLDTPVGVPWINPEAFKAERSRDVFTIPSAAGAMLASVLGPLARADWREGARATVMMPASTLGRDAIEELSRQVVTMFNSGTAPRRVFPEGLAFDLLPWTGELGSTGWSSAELRTTAEVARMVGVRCDVTAIVAPLFSGMGAVLSLDVPAEYGVDRVVELLEHGGVQVATHDDMRRTPRPRTVEGSPFARVARVRRSLDGGSVVVWVSMDNLRTVAVAAVGATALLLGKS